MRLDQHQRLLSEAVTKERDRAKITIDAMSRMTVTVRLLEAAHRVILRHDLLSEYVAEAAKSDPDMTARAALREKPLE